MKVALITGANKGIGLEWCRQLAVNGYKVVATARSLEKLNAAVSMLTEENLSIHCAQMDVLDQTSFNNVHKLITEQFGKLDLLVNNAGISGSTLNDPERRKKSSQLDLLEEGEVLNMIRVNGLAPIFVARAFKDLLGKGDGAKIINISSQVGSLDWQNRGGRYSYATSKVALNMMNRSLAYDLEPDGIASVVVHPGWVKTDMGGDQADLTPEESVKSLRENVLLKITLKDSGKFYNYTGKIHPW